MSVMIDVNNVSMRFRMANDRVNGLKEYIINCLRGKTQYSQFEALNNVSFTIEKGEVVGIVGKNGAGKSTLLKIVSGILRPTEGVVNTYGNIAPMLELGSGFDFDMTGRENIYLNGAILGYSKEFLDDQYLEIVRFSGLSQEFLNAPIRNYSSGMVARLAFSIAVSVKPEVLIVDEVLAVGDAEFQEKSRAKMIELMKGGATVLFVSHDIKQVKQLCSRIIKLEKGRIVYDGDVAGMP